MTSARTAAAKKAEKNRLDYWPRPTSFTARNRPKLIGAAHTAWSAARRGGGANETDAGNLYDVIAGSSLDGGSLGFEILEIERLGLKMLHRLSTLSRSQRRRGSRDGRWAT